MNYEIVWFDREETPVIETTTAPVDGTSIFATFSQAKASALATAISAAAVMHEIANDLRRLRKGDVR